MLFPDTSASTAATPKLISIYGGAFNPNTVVYTVPLEKTFTGHVFARGADGAGFIVNDVNIPLTQGPQTAPTLIPLTFFAGTVVKNPASNYSYWLIGVEQ